MIKTMKATVRGQEITLTYNAADGYWEATLTAPADSSFHEDGGFFPVSVTAEDTAGNSSTIDSSDGTFGQFIRLFNKEENKPVVEILSPTSGAYITTGRPQIKVKITDNNYQASGYSGINPETVDCKINGEDISKYAPNDSDISVAEVEGGYMITCTPSVDIPDSDNVVIAVNAKDNDGNAADTATVIFAVDTLAPQLTVDSPVDGFETNQAQQTVSVTTEPGVSVVFKLNGTKQGDAVIADANGHAEKTITMSKQGENVIEVTASDAAGLSTTITRKIVFNTTAPVFAKVEMVANGKQITQSNPALAGKVYTIRVKMDE
ncbi:MAG: hypothetical protein NC122_06365 [Faecalibacterium sp.]|nr:hypothetical protein [Ruminococcus sp.]MCM1392118.1 hypothetical protein [Ruminococcus sp.]MCM1485815.1 hypothetical protein [Faecalibacterium sp.]